MSGRAALLALRAAAFWLVASSLGAFGHWAASGRAPGLLPGLAFTLLIAVLIVPLLRRERGWLSIAVALGAVQLGLHAAYTASFGPEAHGSPAAARRRERRPHGLSRSDWRGCEAPARAPSHEELPGGED